jgi:geranylgeranylglycerol-phosphate geranylgeranyltransferase
MSAAAIGVGAVVAVGLDGAVARAASVALGALVAFLFTGAGNALNDVYDRDVDRVNHPERPIPSGRVTPEAAFDLALVLFAAAAFLGLLINVAALGLVLLSLALMVSYESRFKANGWSGNLLIGWLVGSLFLFAGLCAYGGEVRPMQVAASLAVLAGLSTVGREIVKDIEDVAGDVGRATLPKTRGVPFAGRAAQAFLALAVVLSAVPAALGILSSWYAPTVAAADGIFIYAALHATRSPGRSELAMKAAMVVALAAFLAGGLG